MSGSSSIGRVRAWSWMARQCASVPRSCFCTEAPASTTRCSGPATRNSPTPRRLSTSTCVVKAAPTRGDPSRWTVDVWAEDVRGLCDVVGIEHPVMLGWSAGGTVAMAIRPQVRIMACSGGGPLRRSPARRRRQHARRRTHARHPGHDARDPAAIPQSNTTESSPLRFTNLPGFGRQNRGDGIRQRSQARDGLADARSLGAAQAR